MNKFAVFLLFFCALKNAEAALSLDRTRIIFPEESNLETIRVNNPSEKTYLSQSWLTDSDGKEISDPFVVIPPVVRVETKDYAIIRIQKLPSISNLPSDRESLFYFHLREVPPKHEKEGDNKLVSSTGGSIQFAIESVIKLFYRPKNLNKEASVDLSVLKGTRILKSDGKVWIENNSPFYATYFSIKNENNKSIDGIDSMMLKPYEKSVLPLNIGKSYYITYINDYGALVTSLYSCNNSICSYSKKIK